MDSNCANSIKYSSLARWRRNNEISLFSMIVINEEAEGGVRVRDKAQKKNKNASVTTGRTSGTKTTGLGFQGPVFPVRPLLSGIRNPWDRK